MKNLNPKITKGMRILGKIVNGILCVFGAIFLILLSLFFLPKEFARGSALGYFKWHRSQYDTAITKAAVVVPDTHIYQYKLPLDQAGLSELRNVEVCRLWDGQAALIFKSNIAYGYMHTSRPLHQEDFVTPNYAPQLGDLDLHKLHGYEGTEELWCDKSLGDNWYLLDFDSD